MTSKVTCSVTGSVTGGPILQIEVKGRRSKRLSQSSGLLTSGLRYLNGALWSRVSDGHLVVQGISMYILPGPSRIAKNFSKKETLSYFTQNCDLLDM